MGCVVNGPGESKHADIGISLPGHRRSAGGAGLRRRQEDGDAEGRAHRGEFQAIVEAYVRDKYGRKRIPIKAV
jgi:(E)-4-hydroxy-3-methylbut-2-enyl-diphosphate synthase